MDITTPEGRRDYIFSNWPTVAAYAYTGYQKYGRGLLVIECTNVDPTEDMQYWRQAAAEEAGVGEQTAVYNPEEEVLIVFSLPEGNQFARFRPDDSAYAPPRMAAQAPPADELWEDAEA